MSITKVTSDSPSTPSPEESFCYCNDDISLQMISGGGAPEGYRGRVTLLLDDDVYVDYIRKDLYDALKTENEALLKANLDCVDHFNAALQDLKLSEDLRKANLEQYNATIEKFKIKYQLLYDFAALHKISYVDLFVMVEKATGIQQPLR